MDSNQVIDQQGNKFEPVSVKEWMLTIFLVAIPLVGVVMMFVWAFGSGANPSKQNWAKASLIWALIFLVIYIIFAVIFGAAFMAAASSQGM